MFNLLNLIAKVKLHLDQDSSMHILSYIGYEFTRSKMFKLRPEERTASAHVNKEGFIYDFGSGWGGDMISVLKVYHGYSTIEATKYLADSLGISYEE